MNDLFNILILCGGRGKRMGSDLKRIPKPLHRINNVTILEHKIMNYYNQGFKDILLAVGYQGDIIKKTLRGSKLPKDIDIEFSDAGGNAGILKRICEARNFFGDSVLITYGDTFTNLNLFELGNVHTNSTNEATIVVAPFRNPFGLVEYDDQQKVIHFKEKPILKYYIGYAIINKTSLDLIPKKVIEMPDGDGIVTFYRILSAMNELGVYFHSDLHVTFNTPEELEIAKQEIANFFTVKDME